MAHCCVLEQWPTVGRGDAWLGYLAPHRGRVYVSCFGKGKVIGS